MPSSPPPPPSPPAIVQFQVAPDCPDKDAFQRVIATLPPGILPPVPSGRSPEVWRIQEPASDKAWAMESKALGLDVPPPESGQSMVGWNIPDEHLILVRKTGCDSPTGILYHEILHCSWKMRLTQAQRDAWTRLYKHDLRRHRTVTWYAGADRCAEEGYCEAGRLYLTGNKPYLATDFAGQFEFLDRVLEAPP